MIMRTFKGKRSIVYKFSNFAIKVKRKDNKAVGRINNEGRCLKRLNKHKIGPKVYFFNDSFLIMSYIKGTLILDYFKEHSKKENLKVAKEIFRQCRILDNLHMNKEEMHHPLKHIIIGKRVVMIDFERCRYSKKPQNVTQFAQFLVSCRFKVDKLKLKKLLQDYKKNYSDLSYKKIVGLFINI